MLQLDESRKMFLNKNVHQKLRQQLSFLLHLVFEIFDKRTKVSSSFSFNFSSLNKMNHHRTARERASSVTPHNLMWICISELFSSHFKRTCRATESFIFLKTLLLVEEVVSILFSSFLRLSSMVLAIFLPFLTSLKNEILNSHFNDQRCSLYAVAVTLTSKTPNKLRESSWWSWMMEILFNRNVKWSREAI